MEESDISPELTSDLRQAITTLSHQQFDQLIFFLINEVEDDSTVRYVPNTQQSDINIKVDRSLPLLTIQYGVAVMQRLDGTQDSSEIVTSVSASVDESNCVDVGVIITASTLTDGGESLPVDRGTELIDGDRLATLLIEHDLGINKQNGALVLNKAFWDLFRGQTRTGVIDSLEIPQADSIPRLRQALSAIANDNHHKEDIARAIERMSDENFEPRQADYYSTAGWLLGFLHKERRSKEVSGRGRWGITRLGQTYVSAYESGNHTTADRILSNQIRSIEIVRRILEELQNERSLSRDSLIDIIARESELSGSTVGRRARSVVNWMTELSEVHNGSGERYISYSENDESTVERASTQANDKVETTGNQLTKTDSQGPIEDENQILDDIMSSFDTVD